MDISNSQAQSGNKTNNSENVETPAPPVGKITATPVIESADKSVPPSQAMQGQAKGKKSDIRPKWIASLESIPQWQNIIATVILGFFSILSSIGSIMSACSAKASADAAIENIRILKVSVRADIAVIEPDYQTLYPLEDRINDRLEATFSVVNSGQTSAYTVEDSTYIGVRPRNAKLVMPKSTNQLKQSNISANTRQEREAKSIEVLSKEQIAGIKSGDLKIFLWGIIAYKDIFNEHHRTEFCFEYVFDQQKFQDYSNYDKTK